MQTAAEDVGLAAQSWGTDLNSYFDAMRRYFTFSGRSSRSQFWLYTLFLVILVIVGLVIDDAIGSDLGQGPGAFGATIFVAHLIPSLTVTVRRLHDSDRSGFWCLVGLVPLVGSIIQLVLLCAPSTPGPNRFGPLQDVASTKQPQIAAGKVPAVSGAAPLDQLEKLAALRASGVIDETEFQQMKADVLARGAA